jgi:hypothetical protein
MMQKHTARTAVVAQPERKARRVSARVLACRPPSCFSASAVHIDWLIETSSGLGMNPAGATTNNIVAIEDPARVAQRAHSTRGRIMTVVASVETTRRNIRTRLAVSSHP